MTGLYANRLPADVRARVALQRALIEEGRANHALAVRHLNAMSPARRAQLEADWLAGEALNDRARIDAERREIVARTADVVGLDRSLIDGL